jgi:periplasmic mercuric ion binding protein
MKLPHVILWFGVCGVLTAGAAAPGETKVELKGVHLCCPACVGSVAKILKTVDGVTGKCDRTAKTVTITAKDAKAAQQALDALAAGGFHGETGNKTLTVKDDSGAPKGKVTSLALTGVHNCCGSCCKAIKATVKTVDGVTGDTATPKKGSFSVTGNFDAGELVRALNAAGFHVTVQKQ